MTPASPGEPAQGERDPRPVVRLPRPALPGAVIALIAAIIALILFLVLEGRRRSVTPLRSPADASAAAIFSSPPPLAVPPEPEPVLQALPLPAPQSSPVVPIIVQQPRGRPMFDTAAGPAASSPSQIPVPVPPAGPLPATSRYSEAAIVFDNGPVEGSASAGPSSAGGNSSAPATAGAVADDSPARTTVIRNRSTIMPVGTMIPAVLETPIDSARPGLVRAVVSQDIRGFDGKRVLVSRGSRLIGEYQSDVRSGQNRVLVTWTRLIRPDGVAIRIGSPAADALGGSGIPGQVNNFFFQRFTSAVLQSALAIGVNLASRPGNGSVIIGLPANSASNIGQELLPANDLRPKIKVKQGVVVNVFVARDLDFSGTPLLSPESIR